MPTGTPGAGRREKHSVTTLGGDTDGYVRAVKYTYDDVGRTRFVTSWSGSDCTGTVRNEVAFAYDGDTQGDAGWGGITKSWQAHSGATDTSASPYVEYHYAPDASGSAVKSVRLDYVKLPRSFRKS